MRPEVAYLPALDRLPPFLPSKDFWGIFGPGGLRGEKRRAMPDFPQPGGAYLALPSHTYRATIRRYQVGNQTASYKTDQQAQIELKVLNIELQSRIRG